MRNVWLEFVSLSIVRITWKWYTNTHNNSPNRFEFKQLDFANLLLYRAREKKTETKRARINAAGDSAFVSWRFSGVVHTFNLMAFVNVVFVGRWFVAFALILKCGVDDIWIHTHIHTHTYFQRAQKQKPTCRINCEYASFMFGFIQCSWQCKIVAQTTRRYGHGEFSIRNPITNAYQFLCFAYGLNSFRRKFCSDLLQATENAM